MAPRSLLIALAAAAAVSVVSRSSATTAPSSAFAFFTHGDEPRRASPSSPLRSARRRATRGAAARTRPAMLIDPADALAALPALPSSLPALQTAADAIQTAADAIRERVASGGLLLPDVSSVALPSVALPPLPDLEAAADALLAAAESLARAAGLAGNDATLAAQVIEVVEGK